MQKSGCFDLMFLILMFKKMKILSLFFFITRQQSVNISKEELASRKVYENSLWKFQGNTNSTSYSSSKFRNCEGFPGNFSSEDCQYNQLSDYWNQSHNSITGSGLLTTYAHGYCHGCQKLENCNLHLDLWHL